jgi:SulP family sulfate permease
MLDKSNLADRLARFIPVFDWGRTYNRDALGNDMVAAVIVTIMLIPQSLAYALLAGLPAETGIYASIAPIVLYAIFGTSRALAVGPVAVVSLMTAAAIGNLAEPGSPELLVAAITLAFISGLFLILLGVFRLGLPRQFPVASGHCRFHHRVGNPDRAQPVAPCSRHSRRRRQSAEQIGSLIENIGQINPDHACDRGQRNGFSVLGPQGAHAALAGDRDEPKTCRRSRQGRSGGRSCCHHFCRLGP